MQVTRTYGKEDMYSIDLEMGSLEKVFKTSI
jgi:hypothetical protein